MTDKNDIFVKFTRPVKFCKLLPNVKLSVDTAEFAANEFNITVTTKDGKVQDIEFNLTNMTDFGMKKNQTNDDKRSLF